MGFPGFILTWLITGRILGEDSFYSKGELCSSLPLFFGAMGPDSVFIPILYFYFCPPDGVTFHVESHQRRRGNPRTPGLGNGFFTAGDPKPFTTSYRLTASSLQLVLCEPCSYAAQDNYVQLAPSGAHFSAQDAS